MTVKEQHMQMLKDQMRAMASKGASKETSKETSKGASNGASNGEGGGAKAAETGKTGTSTTGTAKTGAVPKRVDPSATASVAQGGGATGGGARGGGGMDTTMGSTHSAGNDSWGSMDDLLGSESPSKGARSVSVLMF